ncbi:MAG: XRE family transcriptional regulator [Oscillospiraceae bacterium]|jgi:transcriptional regulator with XRE-family HTH domain|nr:XRE family transcriptional regulator [Oscillospiraceae bacterium]
MSRLGDLLKLERTRRDMTAKQVARMSGVTEKYLLEVEAGTKIIADDQARRILKRIGLTHQNEADFNLDSIANVVDLNAAKAEGTLARSPDSRDLRPRAGADDSRVPERRAPEREKPVVSLKDDEGGGIFLSALAEVLRQVPIYDAAWKIVGNKILPLVGGKIEGGSPDRVLYFKAPDNSCRGFRVHSQDLVLVLPAQSPIDGAIMLVEYNHHRMLRKIKNVNERQVLLQSYDGEYDAQQVNVSDVTFVGRAARAEIEL